jgi:mRNA-degrading endonuclease RelE of RelBE toxin-antitoxin system
MNFDYEFSKELVDTINKLERKDKSLAVTLNKKIKQIVNSDIDSIIHFKNLRAPLNRFKRIHIGSFVLIFEFKNNKLFFIRFDHHDKVYLF